MQDLTSRLPANLIVDIQKLTGWKKVLIMGLSEGVHDKIFSDWLKLRNREKQWCCRAIDSEVAHKFGISDRMVRKIRKKSSQKFPTTI
jgi:hypothetical protein